MCNACIIRRKPITVSRVVVVVDIAVRVDIPRIVAVTSISTTQPDVLCTTYVPCLSLLKVRLSDPIQEFIIVSSSTTIPPQ